MIHNYVGVHEEKYRKIPLRGEVDARRGEEEEEEEDEGVGASYTPHETKFKLTLIFFRVCICTVGVCIHFHPWYKCVHFIQSASCPAVSEDVI